ncbi:thiamine phosphate synthase [Pseudoruegeria sp. HB172150]|uniref:thiamine phosphate synthase n=1 Tax=Pseudoruegeria sp. HB172150 TaxID=2721164 RepID=UPI0015547E4B|nr:thiamine phosphate synthase [Pseudoruegeria sp. HB172150]
MADAEQPQIYLITPAEVELSSFPDRLATVLDAAPVACLRLALTSTDEDRLMRAGDALREVTHARDVPLVIDRHWQLAERLGLDGVHLLDGARNVRAARKALGQDAIVGAFSGTSRHDGMNAGEAGADYVAFGPCAATALGDGSFADAELFGWWSQMIEVPVVAEGGLTAELVASLAPVTDFFAIGPEIWKAEDPAEALKTLASAIL